LLVSLSQLGEHSREFRVNATAAIQSSEHMLVWCRERRIIPAPIFGVEMQRNRGLGVQLTSDPRALERVSASINDADLPDGIKYASAASRAARVDLKE
jgi:hypothetical protein